MAARQGYGATDSQHPYYRLSEAPGQGQADFSQLTARAREQGNEVRTGLQRLEQLARDIGTARDGTQLRSEIEQLMKDLYGKIQHFNRECANLSRVASQGDVAQKRAASSFQGNLNEFISNFQRMSKEVQRLQRDVPLNPSNPFGETDDYDETSQRISVEQQNYQQGQLLSLEHDRRDIQERNEAMTALFRDIQDLNSMAKEMAIQVDTQQDQINLIEDQVDGAGENVNAATANLRKAAWYQKKNRKLKIVIAIVIIVIILAIVIAIILGVCLGTTACKGQSN